MLTTAQIDHFCIFGFVALPGLLGQYAEALRYEVDAALHHAYAATYGFEQQYRGFDRERYPTWLDWLAEAPLHPRRAQVAEHLRRVGALDLPGAEIGW